jgi:hypothetical protein
MTKVTRTLCHRLFTGRAFESAIDSTHPRIVQAIFLWAQFLLVLCRFVSFKQAMREFRGAHTIASGYSILTTLIRLISSGEKRPNWISWIVFSGALEYGKLRFAMTAVVVARSCAMEDSKEGVEVKVGGGT